MSVNLRYEEAPDLDAKRVVMVTGATGTIGQAIVRQLAENEGTAVVLLGRDAQKSEAAARIIAAESGNPQVRYTLADVSRKASIEALAARWKGRLDVLINNAAVVPRTREETPEGIELQLATNVLGYVWMTRAFGPILAQTAPSRVVNVASYWAGDLRLDDLEFQSRRYTPNEAYRQSKQANRMLTVAFAERMAPLGVTVNACHPGTVDSPLLGNLGYEGRESAAQGARTPVWLAMSEAGGRATGKYFRDCEPFPCRFAEDKQLIERLYDACLSY